MGIFSRFTDIINANINSLLDKAEDPHKMVKLIIQEMEDTLVEVRSSSAKTIADKKDLERELESNQAQIRDWQAKAKLALVKEREDLARAALQEKRKLEQHDEWITKELSLVQEALDKLQNEIEQLQKKLQDARAREKTFVMRKDTADSRLQIKKSISPERLERTTSRFEQYDKKIDAIDSAIDAYDMQQKPLAEQFAELAADDEIEAELAALKRAQTSGKSDNEDKLNNR